MLEKDIQISHRLMELVRLDNLEKKTNVFYRDYLPEVLAQIDEIREAGVDTSELERLTSSLEEAINKKDYLTADYLIEMLLSELESARERAGLPGWKIFF